MIIQYRAVKISGAYRPSPITRVLYFLEKGAYGLYCRVSIYIKNLPAIGTLKVLICLVDLNMKIKLSTFLLHILYVGKR